MTLSDLVRPSPPVVDLRVPAERAAELRAGALRWPDWPLTQRQLCDLELLSCGGFSPLQSFLDRDDHRAVCERMRLDNETLWPIPIMLDVPDDVLAAAAAPGVLALRDPEGELLAALHVSDVWRVDRRAEAEAVLGTTDERHPGVEYLLRRTHPSYVTGRLEVLALPEHRTFRDLRHTPAQLRAAFAERGWDRVVAFQTRNPMHRAHQQLTVLAARSAGAKLLIHPVVGMGRPEDVPSAIRVRCYRALLPEYPPSSAMLSVLPLAMRMAGPREALWHAIIRRNFGATHFIVGRDHAGPGDAASGRPFYPPYAAQQLLARYAGEIGVDVIPFRRMMYLPDEDRYRPEDEIPAGSTTRSISGTELRDRLANGAELPAWFTPPAVAAELRRSYPPLTERGFTVFFTGLSGAGKSTIAGALCAALHERFGRTVTLLDGDVVRSHLSSDLGFTPTDRDRNILRIGYLAAEITRHRGVAVCAAIAPYDRSRSEVRRMVESCGGFVLVHVATRLEVCEQRDRKDLYARARAGLVQEFTGISDPYEAPADAEVVIDTGATSVSAAVEAIVDRLAAMRYLPTPTGQAL